MRITFDPQEAEGLRATARMEAMQRPLLAYALEKLASEGIDLEECTTWDELREQYGIVPGDNDSEPNVA